MHLRRLVLISLLGGLPACTMHDDSMSDHVEQFDEHVAAYQSELDSHYRDVSAATNLRTIRDLEQSHRTQSADQMAGMRHEMGDMMGCASSKASWVHSSAATDEMARMDDECDRHQDAMVQAGDLESAQEEETAHHRSMTDMLEQMRAHTDSMTSGMMSMGCSHHNN